MISYIIRYEKEGIKMFDEELIERICNLTCSDEDVFKDNTLIKYDVDYPFKKYYNANTIINAIKKYASHEWSDKKLAHWACIYFWILAGGNDQNLKEDLNSFEEFYAQCIIESLDSLSFFESTDLEKSEIQEWLEYNIEYYTDLNHIWETREKWQIYYYLTNEFVCFDDEDDCKSAYTILVNNETKEFAILYADCFCDFLEEKTFTCLEKNKIYDLVEELKRKEYQELSCSTELSDD